MTGVEGIAGQGTGTNDRDTIHDCAGRYCVRRMLLPILWHALPQLWVGRQAGPWLILVSCWVVSCMLLLCIASPVRAKPKAVPTRRSVPATQKGVVAAERSYEQRLQRALELTHHKRWQQALQTIGPLDGIAVVTPTIGRLWFLRATLAHTLADTPSALHAWSQVWQHYPPLADYAAWDMAQYYAAQALLPELQDTVSALAQHYPFSRLVPPGQFLLGQTQQRLGHVAEAQTTLEHLLQTWTDHPILPEACVLLGHLYAETGELWRAFQILQRAGESYPRHPLAASAFERSRQLLALLPTDQHPPPVPEAVLASIDVLAEAQLWSEVEARLATLDAVTEPSTLVIHVLLKRAAVALRRERLSDAQALLQQIVQRFPHGAHLGEVRYLQSIVRTRQGARVSLDQPHLTPHDHAPLLHGVTTAFARIIGMLGVRQAFAARPAAYAQRLLRDMAPGESAARSAWQAGWEQYRQGLYDTAAQHWDGFETRFPRTVLVPQVLYWQARAAALAGHDATALRLYRRLIYDFPGHYYHHLAISSLRQLQNAQRAVEVPEETPPTIPWTPPRPPAALEATTASLTRERFHFIRVQELQRLRMYPVASQEIHTLSPLLPNTPPTRYFLATLFTTSQEYAAVLRLLGGMTEGMLPAEVRGLPQTFWTMIYPRAFWPEVLEQSKRVGLNPYLVLSMMRQESAFDPVAVSPAGARGVMQLMPATAQEVASRVSPDQVSREQLHNPAFSITLGAHYFAGLLTRYQGNTVLALAAYNAGPGQVTRWLAQWPNLPMEEWIEHIPFDETRAYVKLVLRNLAVYERVYAAS